MTDQAGYSSCPSLRLWVCSTGRIPCCCSCRRFCSPGGGQGRQGKKERTGVLFIALAGISPLLAWEVFALVYYGFLVPNPAYAKLGAGIPVFDLVGQGALYYLNSLKWDPVTLLMTGLALVQVMRRGGGETGPLVLGVLLYAVYILGIGGDFMSGRFFAAPLFCSTLMLVRTPVKHTWLLVLLAAVLIAGGMTARSPLWSGTGYTDTGGSDGEIADQRGENYQRTGFLIPYYKMASHPIVLQAIQARARGPHVITAWGIGFLGYVAGPEVHIVDRWALGDALLARLPGNSALHGWRIGHFTREIPGGYIRTLKTGVNCLEDPGLAAFYDRLSIITRGKIFSLERLKEILKMNFGMYDHLIDGE